MKYAKLLLVTIMFSTLLILTGCTSESDQDAKLFKETYDNMLKQYNCNFDMSLFLNINGVDLSSETKMKMDMESDTVGEIELELEVSNTVLTGYIDLDGQNAITYLYFDFLEVWTKTSLLISEFYEEEIGTDDYALVLTDYLSYKAIDDDTLSDGTDVKVFEFTINDSDIIIDSLGENYDISEFGLSEEELDGIFENVVYIISIDEKEKLIRKIEIDMKPILNDILDLAKSKDSSITDTFATANVIMEFYNFGNVEVTIPADVKSQAISTDI